MIKRTMVYQDKVEEKRDKNKCNYHEIIDFKIHFHQLETFSDILVGFFYFIRNFMQRHYLSSTLFKTQWKNTTDFYYVCAQDLWVYWMPLGVSLHTHLSVTVRSIRDLHRIHWQLQQAISLLNNAYFRVNYSIRETNIRLRG